MVKDWQRLFKDYVKTRTTYVDRIPLIHTPLLHISPSYLSLSYYFFFFFLCRLKRVCILVDSRRGFDEKDFDFMKMMDRMDVAPSYQVIPLFFFNLFINHSISGTLLLHQMSYQLYPILTYLLGYLLDRANQGR